MHLHTATIGPLFSPPFAPSPPPVGPDEEINNVSPGTFSGESIQREGFRFYSAGSPGHIPVEISRRSAYRTYVFHAEHTPASFRLLISRSLR